jgi:branched-chain amino acid transport system permease protein
MRPAWRSGSSEAAAAPAGPLGRGGTARAGTGSGGSGRWVAASLLVAATLPAFLASDYQLFQLTMMTAYAMAILGLNMVMGFNGQISLGHGAFYAAGAYVTAILMSRYGLPYWATLPVAAAVGAMLGFFVGLPALRFGGLSLALTTFAFAVATPQILKYRFIEAWTGGVQGLLIAKPEPPFGLPLDADQWLYLFVLGVASVCFLLARNLLRGRIGLAMKATRDHAIAAEAVGIDVASIKLRTFAASAMLTGVAGSLGAVAVQFVSPDSFSVFLSISFFVGAVVGGVTSLTGAVIGGAFIEFVPDVADQISKAAPGAIYGTILIVFLFLMPSGVAGLLGDVWERLQRERLERRLS